MLLSLAGTGYLRGLQDTRTPLVIAVGANVVEPRARGAAGVRLRPRHRGLGVGHGHRAGRGRSRVPRRRRAQRAARHARRSGRTAAYMRAAAVVGGHLTVRTASLLSRLPRDDRDRVADRRRARSPRTRSRGRCWYFLALALDAVAIAAQAIVGRYLGAADPVATRRSSRRMLEWGVVTGCGAASLLVAVPTAARRRCSPTTTRYATSCWACCGPSRSCSRSPRSCSSSTASSSARASRATSRWRWRPRRLPSWSPPRSSS